MDIIRRMLAEPFFQFLTIGAIVFGLYSFIDRGETGHARQTVEVGPGRIAQLYQTFFRTWQRPPTDEEMRGLVDAYVKEEIFYREGRKLGLDRDDTVFRRRLQQKMEFLMEPGASELSPSDEELAKYLKDNREKFRMSERIAFRQIFLNPQKRGGEAEADAAALLNALRSAEGEIDVGRHGDPTLLPQTVPLVTAEQIENTFGKEFAQELSKAEAGIWTGPWRSTYGRHLVRVDQREAARDPALDEIRDVVLREWQADKRRKVAEERYLELKEKYEVKVTWPAPEGQEGAPNSAATQ
ncbi:peptidyl-prolyl cis-trans isomerase [Rhizobiales bacterium]|uniref:peptidylprolyl isomerase n=1 Tax=Hongsoonwoonella zoysiae TaxID=2821844 RepID=UPI00155F8535|nr:peptidylprolyl isomerase [Hongsoonwoonella zoysiae]NRG17745.1 peptidyl-prolyl cis-trans isomerase [Hongsoonwoonella zoysiae]